MVSGGWVSAWAPPEAMLTTDMNRSLGFTTLLDKGYTVFLVRHGSSPLFKVPECIDDVRRAARHVRLHAADWGVDPSRLGVYGASAGGHLSLMLGTTGDDGKPDATDPLEKAGSRIAAVVAIFPPTELKSYLESESFRQQLPRPAIRCGRLAAGVTNRAGHCRRCAHSLSARRPGRLGAR